MGQLLQRFADVKAGRGRVKERPPYNPYGLRLRVGGIRIAGVTIHVDPSHPDVLVHDWDAVTTIQIDRKAAAKLVKAIRGQVRLLMQRHDYGKTRSGESSAAEACWQRAKCAARVVAAYVRSKTDKIRQWPGMSIRIFGNRSGAEVSTTRGDVWLFSRSQAAEFLRGYRSSARKADAERHAALATYAAESKTDKNR